MSDPHSFGIEYEKTIPHDQRRALGAYYTNPTVARKLIEATIPNPKNGDRILDPACGGGVFLVEVIRHYQRHDKECTVTGWELDHRAADAAYKAVTACDYGKATAHISARDSLVEWLEGKPILEFEYLVGNPPFLSLKGRGAQTTIKVPKDRIAACKARSESCNWYAIHCYFVEMVLTSTAARIGFILPSNLATSTGYQKWRDWVAANSELEQIIEFGNKEFDDAALNVTGYVFDLTGEPITRKYTRNGSDLPFGYGAGRVWLPEIDGGILKRIQAMCPPASARKMWYRDCGCQTSTANTTQNEPVVALRGSDISLFRSRAPTSTFRGIQNPSSFDKQRAVRWVIRQTGTYPVVAPKEPGWFFQNSLHGIGDALTQQQQDALAAILNSEFVRVLYSWIHQPEVDKGLPQVTLGKLREIPIPDFDNPIWQLSSIVELILEDDGSKFEVMYDHINRVVYEYYQVTEAEKLIIQKRLAELPKPPVRK